jgi:hypothetical protein
MKKRTKIKVFDSIFSHNPYSCFNCDSEYMEWDVNPLTINDGDIVFFTEHDLHKIMDYKDRNIKKIGWLLESPAIINQNKIFDYLNYFDEIYTCREDFLLISSKFKFLPVWCTWIKENEREVYEKNKMISIIASFKRQTDGHRLRHNVIHALGDKMDIYGSGYRSIDNKLIGLKDYRFSIVIENTKQNFYFTEKLLDCFVTGTVPIYWGCPSIDKFFDKEGIINFNNMDELNTIINNINEKTYDNMKTAIKNNFDTAMKYKTAEDYLVNYDIFK